MNPIVFIFTLLVVGFLLKTFLSFYVNHARQEKAHLLKKLYREGAANDLIFCSQEVLQNRVIGIDGIHRKIMILEKTKNNYHCSTISLDEVNDCQVVTTPGFVNGGYHKKWRNDLEGTTLELIFRFNNQSQPASIVFCNDLIKSTKEFIFLKAKAEYWRVMLSKMATRKIEVEA